MGMHENQREVPVATVRALVDAQFPRWRGLRVRPLAPGTVNAVFRLGDQLAVRLPLVGDDPEATRRELAGADDAARELLGRTRFATPAPVAVGEPGPGYPLPWSVHTWVPGTPADRADVTGSAEFAGDLAEFIGGVRAIATRGRTFRGTGRGGDLRTHDEWLDVCFARSAGQLDVPRLRREWATLRTLPRTAPDVMTHGDLIPGNVLIAGGRLVGVIDVGGLGAADPALDLVAAWHLLDAGPRDVLRSALGVDDLSWERGRAWAFVQAMGLVWYYLDSFPAMSRMGRRTLERIMA